MLEDNYVQLAGVYGSSNYGNCGAYSNGSCSTSIQTNTYAAPNNSDNSNVNSSQYSNSSSYSYGGTSTTTSSAAPHHTSSGSVGTDLVLAFSSLAIVIFIALLLRIIFKYRRQGQVGQAIGGTVYTPEDKQHNDLSSQGQS